ncbi:MAG: LPP20 family lipoprotein [Sulfurimonadaceae bacterium]|jgi:hypothetical protein|nr:LPP20 family lipoprotein [Sulfurimonadaceae bacterium]
MKHSLLLAALLAASATYAQKSETTIIPAPSHLVIECKTQGCSTNAPAQQAQQQQQVKEEVLEQNRELRISVIGQGVAPMNTISPAQAYALAKRAAVADAYRLIAEKVKGVRVDGQDLIQNMMVKRSSIRTSVDAMVRDANILETVFKEGLCEVEMEIILSHAQFAQH